MSQEGYELQFVKDAFTSNWIAPLGPHVDAFEQEFAAWHDIRYAAALSSGTAALHLALLLLGVKRDDEVICSSFTFSATANAISYTGAKPVFIDSDARTWNLDPGLLQEFLSKRAMLGRLPKVALIVDIIGQSADWDPIMDVCAQYDIPIIEDAAEALGATYKGRRTGIFGKLSAFSFNGNKIMTTSGGGMLVGDDDSIIKQARFLATQARDPAPHYQHSVIGFNYRMSNVVAAIGRGQLKVLQQRIDKRRETFNYYRSALKDLPGLGFMPEPEGFNSTRWLTSILIDPTKFGATRENVRLALEEHNIESRPLWKPMHLQPAFSGCEVIGGGVSELLFERGLSLPSGSALSEDELAKICGIVKKQYHG